jgi:hypothetical protein
MSAQWFSWEFLLPGFQQEEGNGACGVNCQASNSSVDGRVVLCYAFPRPVLQPATGIAGRPKARAARQLHPHAVESGVTCLRDHRSIGRDEGLDLPDNLRPLQLPVRLSRAFGLRRSTIWCLISRRIRERGNPLQNQARPRRLDKAGAA